MPSLVFSLELLLQAHDHAVLCTPRHQRSSVRNSGQTSLTSAMGSTHLLCKPSWIGSSQKRTQSFMSLAIVTRNRQIHREDHAWERKPWEIATMSFNHSLMRNTRLLWSTVDCGGNGCWSKVARSHAMLNESHRYAAMGSLRFWF